MDKRAWEKEYEKYQNGEMDKRVAELEEKVENKTIKKEEYDELKKINKVKENLYKVTNVLALKKSLEERMTPLKEEIERLSSIEHANSEAERIEKELTNIDIKREKIKKELKTPDLDVTKKAELQSELTKLDLEMVENNSQYLKNQEVFQKNKETKLKIPKGKNIEELKAETFEISQNISKCNMVANNLMKGLSWDAIEVKLDNWKDRKYTAKESLTKLAKAANKSKEEPIEDLSDRIIATTQQQMEEEETALAEQSEFATKHPRLAKIANFIKTKWANIKNRFSGKEAIAEEKPENLEADVKNAEAKEDFKNYLKEVAEKGLEETKKEKLEKAKKQAYNREAEKFGKDYADKSVKNEKEER